MADHSRKKYSAAEDELILKYVEENVHLFPESGNNLWKAMQRSKVTSHPWQSMRKHYLDFILPRVRRMNPTLYCKIVKFTNEPEDTRSVRRRIEVARPTEDEVEDIVEDEIEDFDSDPRNTVLFSNHTTNNHTTQAITHDPSNEHNDDNTTNTNNNNNNTNNKRTFDEETTQSTHKKQKTNSNTTTPNKTTATSDTYAPSSQTPNGKGTNKTKSTPTYITNSSPIPSSTSPSAKIATKTPNKTSTSSSPKSSPKAPKQTPPSQNANGKAPKQTPSSQSPNTKANSKTARDSGDESPTLDSPSPTFGYDSPPDPHANSQASQKLSSGSNSTSSGSGSSASSVRFRSRSSSSSGSDSQSRSPTPKLAARPKPKLATTPHSSNIQNNSASTTHHHPSSPPNHTSDIGSPETNNTVTKRDSVLPPASPLPFLYENARRPGRRDRNCSRQIRKDVRALQEEYNISAPIIFHALIVASGCVANAKKFLEYSQEDGYLPWTPEEDKILSGNDIEAITKLKQRRGMQECLQRCEFLHPNKKK